MSTSNSLTARARRLALGGSLAVVLAFPLAATAGASAPTSQSSNQPAKEKTPAPAPTTQAGDDSKSNDNGNGNGNGHGNGNANGGTPSNGGGSSSGGSTTSGGSSGGGSTTSGGNTHSGDGHGNGVGTGGSPSSDTGSPKQGDPGRPSTLPPPAFHGHGATGDEGSHRPAKTGVTMDTGDPPPFAEATRADGGIADLTDTQAAARLLPVEPLGALSGISFGSGLVLWPLLLVINMVAFAGLVRLRTRGWLMAREG